MKYAIEPWVIDSIRRREQEKQERHPVQVPLELPVGPPPGYYDDRKPSQRRRDEDEDSDDRYIVDIGGNDGQLNT